VEIIHRHTGWQVAKQTVVADELDQIVQGLRDWTLAGLALILTTGGTGFSPRDVTPEATMQVVNREAPGIAEALRSESLKITGHAMLSRARAGIRDSTLIVNLPGSSKAAKEGLDILLPVLPHALELLSGGPITEDRHQAV
jgi:molybdenum cofactor synthesis domain-containing protein